MYEGELIRLREYRESDRAAYLADESDAASHLIHRAGPRHPWAAHELDAYLERSRTIDDERYLFTVAMLTDDAPVGRVVVKQVHRVHRTASFGISLAGRARGRGFGTEATRLACRFAFEALGLHRFWLDVHADNHRAIAVYESCGFRAESRRPLERFHDGHHHDVLVMGLLEQEWRGEAGR